MDFTCKKCGAYEFIPSEVVDKREAIDNLELVVDTFIQYPWIKTWLEHHEPELMNQFYAGIKKLMNGSRDKIES